MCLVDPVFVYVRRRGNIHDFQFLNFSKSSEATLHFESDLNQIKIENNPLNLFTLSSSDLVACLHPKFTFINQSDAFFL